jgi:Ni/Co efflux regulator RcnB
MVMIEKQDADEFDEADDDALDNDEGDAADLARLTRELDQSRKRGAKQGTPALRKLELLAEQRRTRELTSDFEDYDLDEPRRGRRSVT